MYEGYIEYGGVEIVNNFRASTLARQAHVDWFIPGPETDRANIIDSLSITAGSLADYTQAPWYDPDRDDMCGRFYGVYGLSVSGLHDSVRSSPITQNVNDGGVIGVSRRSMRVVRVRAYLLASGRDAAEYGMAWLNAAMALDGCEQAVNCGTGDVRLFSEVPTTPTAANDLSRFLKSSTVSSGPFIVSETGSHGVYGWTVEWSWTSERPWVYGPTIDIALEAASSLSLVQDSPINYVPYPSAELATVIPELADPVIATNVVSNNPGLEVNTTGWDYSITVDSGTSPASYLTASRSNDVAALGSYSYRIKVLGNGSTAAAGVASITLGSPSVSLTGIPAGRLVQCALWSAGSIVSGGSSLIPIHVSYGTWYDGVGAVISVFSMLEDDRGVGVFVSTLAEPPAGAASVRLFASFQIEWSSGSTEATNSDIRLYADAMTVAYFGGI